jgi:tetratricopeptide (TPR) repeat protein
MSDLQSSTIQQTRYRLARHYLTRLQQTSAALVQSTTGARSRWLQALQQDWPQIAHWQGWTADGVGDDERARLCIAFVLDNAEVLRAQQPPLEELGWIRAALEGARRLSDGIAERTLLHLLGLQYLKMEQYNDAEQCGQQLEALAGAAQDEIGLGRAWFLLGDAHNRRSQLDAARTFYGKSQAVLESQPVSEEMALLWAGFGRIDFATGGYETAYAHFLKQLEAGTALNSPRLMGAAHLSLSGVSHYLRSYERAGDHARESLKLGRRAGALRLIAHALVALANAEKILGNLASARMLYEEAMASPPSVLPPSSMINAIYGMADTYLLEGDAHMALQYFERSLALAQETRVLYFRICDSANRIAAIHLNSDRLAEARQHLKIAAENALKMGTPPYLVTTLLTAAYLWLKIGDVAQAGVYAGLLSRYMQFVDAQRFEALTTDVIQALGEAGYAHALEASHALTLESAVTVVLADLQGGAR